MRRRRISRSTHLRLILCVVWASATLITPLESGLLPGPLDQLAAESPAHAQSPSVVAGTPNDCEDGWQVPHDEADLCVLAGPACPQSPIDMSALMQPSDEFPEFCEETITRIAGDPISEANYLLCTGPADTPLEDPPTYSETLPGFAVIVNVDPNTGVESCRILQLATCEVGTRVSLNLCRATARRSWTCDPGQIPLNEFNECYAVPSNIAIPNQLCGAGAPNLVVVSCEDYVGSDFIEPPTAVGCDSYGVAGSSWVMATVDANPYWCEFNASYLKSVCHSAFPPASECGQSTAMCLKRASNTGGCAGVALAMLCRSQQAIYLADAEPLLAADNPDGAAVQRLAELADDVRQQGCEPCQALPFEPIPDHCPEDRLADPVYNTLGRQAVSNVQYQMLEHEQDIAISAAACHYMDSDEERVMTDACRYADAGCGSLPPGNPAWSSTHSSGVAVVNSSVIVRMQDSTVDVQPSPAQFRFPADYLNVDDNSNVEVDWGLVRRVYAMFPGSDTLVRTASRPNPLLSVDEVPRFGNLALKCVVAGLPAFRLVIDELWPDKPDDETAIRELFGTDSLGWWDAIVDENEKRRRTLNRGIPHYWPDASTVEQEARNDALRTKVDCNVEPGKAAWCRWGPQRSGYFRLKVAGAWHMELRGPRGWKLQSVLEGLQATVAAFTEGQRETLGDTLAELGCGEGQTVEPSCAWTPQVLGLNSELTNILPTGPDPDDLLARDPDYVYQLVGDHHRFGGWDLRVSNVESRESPITAKYTETQKFGILVHEVRVSTVTPSR